MRSSRIVLSIAAVLVLTAGWVVGALSAKLGQPVRVGPPAGGPHGHGGPDGRGWFSEALELTPEQRKQLDGIWSDARQQIGKTWDRRRDLDKKRDAAVRALLTPAQQVAYDKVWSDYRAARTALDQDRDRLVRDANDRSKALLTDTQKARWEAMSKDMRDHRPGGGAGGGPGGGGGPPPIPTGVPATRPAENL